MSNPISDTEIRFPSIGKCIYCGTTDAPLYDEHIVPYALAGDALVFESASCKKCADDFNKRFEGFVLKHGFEAFRFRIDAPSRSAKKRKKKKSKFHPIHFVQLRSPDLPSILTASVEVEKSNYPFGFIGLRLHPPKLLQGLPASTEDTITYWTNINHDLLNKVLEKTNQRTVHVGAMDGKKFAQFLAKIAYSYAVAYLGQNAFTQIILPFIEGKTDIYTDLIGGEFEIKPASKSLHELECFIVDMGAIQYQCVRIRLFCLFASPIYWVVIGSVNSPQS